jgi:hypothetical protein
MEEFIKALRVASKAMQEMSYRWEDLENSDNEKVQALHGWGQAFSVSLDEVPMVMWRMVGELEDNEGKQ